MLKNTDLQVGNIIVSGIKFSDNSEIGEVLEIGNDEREFEQVYCQCAESFEWFFKDNYCGVPLTEEWHDIFGVKKDSFMSYVYDISVFNKPDERCLVFSGDYLWLREKNINGPLPYDFMVIWNKDIKKEFYVHEFQNLYKVMNNNKKLKFDVEMAMERINVDEEDD